MTPCIHPGKAPDMPLCETCKEEYLTDPDAWEEFGFHEAGIKRWNDLQEWLRNRPQELDSADQDDVPF